ncbi:MAG: Ig-like domain-containing protein, partial [Bacteroidales bacterium]|nr:Ig-like domain-containing protein [Bacteroidales bacterium]
TLNKTFKMTVKKSFLASGDYIKNTSNVYAPSSTSSGNRDYVGTSSVTTISLCKSNGTPYTEDELQDITWTSNNTSIATLYNTKNASTGVSGAGVGDFTITAKGKDGSTKTYYMTGYKPVSSITPNSTTYTLGLGTAHTMNYTDKDYTVNPSDATYKKSTYFKWQSLTTNVVTMNGDVVYGVGTGTTYVQAAPKPWYATWYNARQIKVVDYRLKVTGGTSRTAPSGTLYKNDDIITIEAGKEATVCFSTTGGTNITYTASFATATTHTSVATVAGNTSSATIKGVAAGTAYIDLDYTGDNGRILQRYQVKVVPTFTWASGDIASNSYNARPKTSPLFLKIGSTNNVYAYKGSGASATQYSSSVAGAVTWTSANTSIATVSPATGNMTTVTAKANGLVEIKGTDSNGSSRSCWVYCYTSVTSVSTKPTMCVGKNCTYSKTLTAGTDFTFSPSNANPYKWKYQSTNTNIATVTEDGVVSVYTGGNEGSATIQVQPYPDGSSIGFKNARTFKVVYWRMYASYSNCTSAGTVQQSDGTVSGGTMGFTSGATLKIDKGSQVNLKFYNVSEGHKLGDGTYTFTNSNSSVATITSTNSDPSNHGSYISVKGVNAGTTSVTLTLNTDNSYFTMSFTIQVI